MDDRTLMSKIHGPRKVNYGGPEEFGELVEAVQSDREAAAELGVTSLQWTEGQAMTTLAGNGDKYPIVQAFARYRIKLAL